MRFRILVALAGLTSTLFGGSASAGLLPTTVTVTPDAGLYRWTYAIVLPTDSQIRAGDYFTIYDFGGFEGSVSQPDHWVFTTALSGPIPIGVDPNDNPLISNLTWTYNGPTIPTGQLGLGNFWALSEFDTSSNSAFTARTHRTSDGVIDTNITETTVPVPTAPPSLPEPGTIVLAALGLPFLGLARHFGRVRRASNSG